MKVRYLMCTLITLGVAAVVFETPTTRAQTSSNPPLRSRSERIVAHRKVEVAYPDVVRALRVLRLPAQKMAEARAILERYEVETRAAREELRQLSDQLSRQDYQAASPSSPREAELNTALAQSAETLRVEIRTILGTEQREQFDRRMESRELRRTSGDNPGRQSNRPRREQP